MTDEKLNVEIFGDVDPMVGGEFIDEDELMEQPGDLHIEDASEVVDIGKEAVLKADMVQLADLDSRLSQAKHYLDNIQVEIEGFMKSEGLDVQSLKWTTSKKKLKKEFDLLKNDIAERGLELSKKTEYEERLPAPGVQIKEFSQSVLVLDEKEAFQWALDNDHDGLLKLNLEKYQKLLESGVFEDMPGKMDNTPRYQAQISLKPYQKEK